MILNIETSSKLCSVALCDHGDVVFSLISDSPMDHAVKLGPFVDRCMEELAKRDLKLDAVAVSMGPGSYTGLRIGLSLAKGVCFGLQIPLIGIPTLEILAVKALFSSLDFDEATIIIPLIDARRMEVYTAAYDIGLRKMMKPQPLILEEDCFKEFSDKPLVMIGDGVEKAKEVLKLEVRKWIDRMPVAADMMALSDKAFRDGRFIDIAYSTPYYLKNFQATTPKNKF